MSLSKEEPRQPRCARCRHHGVLVAKKGHTRSCPFLRCDCWKCSLTTQRTHITALQRDLMRDGQKKQQRPRSSTSGAKGSSSCATPKRGARPSATSGTVNPPSGADSGAQEAGGEQVAGLDRREAPSLASNSSYFGEFGQTSAPLPVIHFPFRMQGYYPSSYYASPDLLFNMPWFPPLPAGLYSDGLCGPLMFPHFQPGSVHQTPPPPESGAPADGRQVFIRPHSASAPETFQEEPSKEEDIKRL